ncbi:hypothetical protein [Streptomyces sp. NPDC086777]|uniref:hypothetical protein n=1 Tax=Streptomyces sp. NPDC086777 TaxID=3154866 RepID=UPI00344DB65B
MAVGRHRRTATLATVAAAVVLTAALVTACNPDSSLDCLTEADSVADRVTAVGRAGADTLGDPARTAETITTVESDPRRIKDRTDDGEVGRAVDDLDRAVRDCNEAVLDGDTDPDPGRIDAAAHRLQELCTP